MRDGPPCIAATQLHPASTTTTAYQRLFVQLRDVHGIACAYARGVYVGVIQLQSTDAMDDDNMARDICWG